MCRASAGSGKTYTLVRQYLEFAFDNSSESLESRFKRILAITFTNKAVNEMKSRIIVYLSKIGERGKAEQMCADLMASMHLSEEEVRRRARAVLGAILHNYSDFSVCTIDSFMHHVVRSFAYDLGLPTNFDVTINEDDVIVDTVDTLMTLYGNEGEEALTSVIDHFANSNMEDEKSYKVDDSVRVLAKTLFDEDVNEHLKKLKSIDAQSFIDKYKEYAQANLAVEAKLQRLGREAIDCYRQRGIEDSDLHYGTRGIASFFKKAAAGKFVDPSKNVLEFAEGDKICSGLGADREEEITELKPTLVDYYTKIMNLKEQEEARYNTRQIVMKELYALALLNRLNRIVDDYYHENDMLHISEFNKRVFEVVQNEPVPFIYERIGNRYLNYLVDEFQDTSKMQWLNIVPLIANGIANGQASLVVGDAKQAIYRFRQGDAHQFVILPKVEGSRHAADLVRAYEAIDLDTNYRTCHNIVAFNNAFFKWVAESQYGYHEELQDIYIGHDATVPSLFQKDVKAGGYVQIGVYRCERNNREPIWKQVLDAIRHQVHDLGYRYSDITVLARSNNILAELSQYIAAHDAEVRVVSSESFLLSNSRRVTLLWDMLHYLLNPKDRSMEGLVLRHLMAIGRLPADSMERKIGHPESMVETLLSEQGYSLQCEALLDMDLYDCCETIVRELDLATDETAYIATFLNLVAQYGNRNRQNLREFLEWFDNKMVEDKLSTSTAEGLDAVRLLTIHKAKGLEAKIIIYPVFNEDVKAMHLWVETDDFAVGMPTNHVKITSGLGRTLFEDRRGDEELKRDMDELNVLYVALTRPKEKLLLFCGQKSDKQKSDKQDDRRYVNLLSRFVKAKVMDGFVEKDDNDGEVVCLGEDCRADGSVETTAADLRVDVKRLSFPEWESRVTVAVTPNPSAVEESIRIGLQAHALLSTIVHKGEAQEALQRYVESQKLSPEEASRLQQMVDRVLTDMACDRFFDEAYAVKNECPLCYRGKELRPDRIVFTPDETWVVDFKTGSSNLSHRKQVLEYCAAIDDMQCYPKSKGFLIYLTANGCEVEEA